MKTSRKIIAVLLAVILMFGSFGINKAPIQAASKSQITSKVSDLQKQIRKLKKQKKAAEVRERKEKKGTTAVVGQIVCRNPYILYDSWTNSYYWVNNSRNMNSLITYATGYVKMTGRYCTYNNVTCVECRAVKVTIKSTGIQTKIDNKTNALQKYKNALKDKVSLKNANMFVGKTKRIERSWKYGGAYNTLKWKSSNTKVATVDKNGKVTARKSGKVTITAKASVSGKISKCIVSVKTPVKKMSFEKNTYQITGVELQKNSRYKIKLSISPIKNDEIVYITSSDTSVAEFMEGEDEGDYITFKIKGVGKTKIIAETKSGAKASCTLTYLGVPITGMKFGKSTYEFTKTYQTIKLDLMVAPAKYNDKIQVTTSNEYDFSDPEFKNGYVYLWVENYGETKVTVKSSNGITASCNVKVSDPNQNNLDDEEDDNFDEEDDNFDEEDDEY